jgi:Dolichyl-phosphate-mannose-protein mannosyltransferase
MAQTSATPAVSPPARTFLDAMSDHIEANSTLWVWVLLLAGFGVRVWRASGTFLNPDEAFHFLLANQTSWRLAYRASLTATHPPLLILLLHAVRSVGTSEMVLRMPSILAGVAFCWLIYKWASLVFGRSVAWIAFILALFLPSTLDLSSEVRQYALLLAFVMAAAYLLERALQTNSASAMLFSDLCLWLAMGSHYSAFLFAAALGIYSVLRMLARRPGRKVFGLWATGQVVGVALGGFFYVTHISGLRQAAGGPGLIQPYLRTSTYVPGKINPVFFLLARTGGVFQYTFAQAVVGDLAFLAFVIGLILLFRKRILTGVPARLLGALLVLPFLVNGGAALARAYPYGGTRHSAFLVPFALAGVSLAVLHLLKHRLAPGIAVTLLVVLCCNLFPRHSQGYMSRDEQSSARMQSALEFLGQRPTPQELLFTDNQSGLVLAYYLCAHHQVDLDHSVPGFLSFECGGQRVIATDGTTFGFSPSSFCDHWQRLVSQYHLPRGTRVWVTEMGWNVRLATELQNYPEFHLAPHFFGHAIQIFDLTVGQAMPDPKLLQTS